MDRHAFGRSEVWQSNVHQTSNARSFAKTLCKAPKRKLFAQRIRFEYRHLPSDKDRTGCAKRYYAIVTAPFSQHCWDNETSLLASKRDDTARQKCIALSVLFMEEKPPSCNGQDGHRSRRPPPRLYGDLHRHCSHTQVATDAHARPCSALHWLQVPPLCKTICSWVAKKTFSCLL